MMGAISSRDADSRPGTTGADTGADTGPTAANNISYIQDQQASNAEKTEKPTFEITKNNICQHKINRNENVNTNITKEKLAANCNTDIIFNKNLKAFSDQKNKNTQEFDNEMQIEYIKFCNRQQNEQAAEGAPGMADKELECEKDKPRKQFIPRIQKQV